MYFTHLGRNRLTPSRYRLMLRRCLENPKPCFGMIMPPTAAGGRSAGNDFGTMLEIEGVRLLHDGRSMVETRGTYRFRIMERGTMDGYMVARIERCCFRPFQRWCSASNLFSLLGEKKNCIEFWTTLRCILTSLTTRPRSRPRSPQ